VDEGGEEERDVVDGSYLVHVEDGPAIMSAASGSGLLLFQNILFINWADSRFFIVPTVKLSSLIVSSLLHPASLAFEPLIATRYD
jgi:hypothetical protein